MDIPFRGNRRNHEVGPSARVGRPPTAPGDQAVADAEDVLADAWVQVLIEARDQSQAKARGAEVRCERAQRTLDAVLVRRQPGAIAAAHADMEQMLLAVDAAHDLYLQAHQRLAAELERLWWRSVRRRVEACIARNGPPQAGGPGEPVGPPVDPPPDPASASLLVRLSRRAVPWASAVAAAFAASGQRK